jgi:hypothetical protein
MAAQVLVNNKDLIKKKKEKKIELEEKKESRLSLEKKRGS